MQDILTDHQQIMYIDEREREYLLGSGGINLIKFSVEGLRKGPPLRRPAVLGAGNNGYDKGQHQDYESHSQCHSRKRIHGNFGKRKG